MDNSKIEKYEYLLELEESKAIQTLLNLVKQGDMDAAYVLGIEYYDGDYTDVNREQSFYFLELAYKAGHLRATHDFGCFIYYGFGFPDNIQNTEKARSIITKSANKGYEPSIKFLESMY